MEPSESSNPSQGPVPLWETVAGRETCTHQNGLKGKTFQQREPVDEVQELTPDPLWLPGSSDLGAWSCRPRDSNTAEGESGLIRISRERDGGSIEGSNRVKLVRVSDQRERHN